MAAPTNVIELGAQAIAAVLNAIGGATPTYKAGYTYDKGRVDPLPGYTMGYMGAKKADDLGIRAVFHHRTWLHIYTVRLQFKFDSANSVVNETEVRHLTAVTVDAVENDPTLGGRVDASGVLEVGEGAMMANAQGKIVGASVDLKVGVAIKGAAWQI